jgi:hypothetical protein
VRFMFLFGVLTVESRAGDDRSPASKLPTMSGNGIEPVFDEDFRSGLGLHGLKTRPAHPHDRVLPNSSGVSRIIPRGPPPPAVLPVVGFS